MSKQSRIQFFDDALRRLRKASQQGFYSLQSQAFLELTGFQQSYPNIPLQRNLHFSYNQIHAYSQSIWPRDASKALIPLKSKGNGNCLYRSVSLLCSGSEDYHLEFRARTVCELVLNSSFYLVEDKCSILSIEGATPIKNVLAATSRSFTQFSSNERSISQLCFQEDCIHSCTPDTYANMWEVHGVSSVTGIPVQSVYPEYNKRHRPAFNILIQPRTYRSKPFDETMLTIMWTRCRAPDAPRTSQQWSPNHFVPCVPTNCLISPSQSNSSNPGTALNYHHKASDSCNTHVSSSSSHDHSHIPYSSRCTITNTQTKNVGAISTAYVHKTFSEVLKSRPKPVSAAASCPKVSTVLLSKTPLSMKGKYKAKGEKQSLSVYSSSRPNQISNDTTQCCFLPANNNLHITIQHQPALWSVTL